MVEVVGVRFKDVGKIYYFDPDGLEIEEGTNVIVETARGMEYGNIAIANRNIKEEEIVQPLKKIIRLADRDDNRKNKENKKREVEAIGLCEKEIEKHGLEMKLIDCELTFDNTKIIFYFTADGRIDFRELVKDLAAIFRMRIELRQIGVRDEAKMMGSIGICGRKLCCSTFLGELEPVTIKMAKEQSLSLNPAKISGICGRLMCCLRYEEETYKELNELLPDEGDLVLTPNGKGEVLSVSPLRGLIKVAIRKKDKKDKNDEILIEEFKTEEIKRLTHKKKVDFDDDSDITDELREISD